MRSPTVAAGFVTAIITPGAASASAMSAVVPRSTSPRTPTGLVIEWGTWAREERDVLREGASALGAGVELRFLDEPVEVLWGRV